MLLIAARLPLTLASAIWGGGAVAQVGPAICSAPGIDDGMKELENAKGDPRRATKLLREGIGRVEGRRGACARELARAYVYLGVCHGKLVYVPPSAADRALGLSEDEFVSLKSSAAYGAFEHAVRLDPTSARETFDELVAAGVVGSTWNQVFLDASVFQPKVRPEGRTPGWFVLAVGGFVSFTPVSVTKKNMGGPYLFAGAKSPRGKVGFGFAEGFGFNGGLGVGPGVRFGGQRLGVVLVYGWRFPTGSAKSDRRRDGLAVGIDYRLR